MGHPMTRKQRGKKARGGLSSNNKTKRLFFYQNQKQNKRFSSAFGGSLPFHSILVAYTANNEKQHMMFNNRIKEDFRFVISIMEGNRDERIRQF